MAICRDDPSVCAVYIFGSYANGHIGPTSDVDVLLVRDTSLIGHSRGTDLIIAANAQALIDLLVVTPTEFADRLATTSFGRTILSSMQRIDAA